MRKHGLKYAGAAVFIQQRQRRLFNNLNIAISRAADRRLDNPSVGLLMELNEARTALSALAPPDMPESEGLIWAAAGANEAIRLTWAGWRAFKAGQRQQGILTERNFWRLAAGRREFCVGCEQWKKENKARHYAVRFQKRTNNDVQAQTPTTG
jgi:hypothetical protein